MRFGLHPFTARLIHALACVPLFSSDIVGCALPLCAVVISSDNYWGRTWLAWRGFGFGFLVVWSREVGVRPPPLRVSVSIT